MADSTLGPQWRNLARVVRGEKRTDAAARSAIQAMLDYSATALAAAGYDGSTLDAKAAGWTKVAAATILPQIEEVFRASFEASARGIIDPEPYATRHLEATTNRLVGVPDEVFDTMRGELAAGRLAGEGIPQLAARVGALLADADRWAGRASTIARTEVIGANNAGAHGSAVATAELLGEDPSLVVKEWLATGDARTRPSHQPGTIDSVMGLDTPFQVGGVELLTAGDPFGDPAETVNCRCTVLYHYPGDPEYPTDLTAPGRAARAADTAAPAEPSAAAEAAALAPAAVEDPPVDPGPRNATEHAVRSASPEELAQRATMKGTAGTSARRELKRRGLTAAAADEPCTCCGGSGEHDCGHECYVCDGGMSLEAQMESGTGSSEHLELGDPILCAGHHGRPDPERPEAHTDPADSFDPTTVPAGTPTVREDNTMAEDTPTEDRTGVVIVALPAASDPCHTIGPEDKHCTLVFLGDTTEMAADLPTREDTIAAIEGWLAAEVAGSGPMSPFPEAVTGVESLGPEGARVWKLASDDGVTDLHNALLSLDPVTKLAGATEQYPTYTPHVTIGYADVAPAEGADPADDVTVEGQLDPATEEAAAAVESITFDRIALWWAGESTEWVLADATAPDTEETDVPDPDPAAAALQAALADPKFAASLAALLLPFAGITAAEGNLPEDQAPAEGTPATASEIAPDGDPFYGILWPEATDSGDGRKIASQGTVWRELPLPFMAQEATAMGHDGAVRVGRIDSITRDEDTYAVPVIRYAGVWDTSEAAVETARQVENKVARGISVDGDDVVIELQGSDGAPLDPMVDDFPEDGIVLEVATSARIAGATACSVPAFQQAYVANGVYEPGVKEPGWNADGTPLTTGQLPQEEAPADADPDGMEPLAPVMASAWSLVAAAGPVWAVADFADPKLTEPTRLTVTDDGRVYGHLATWGTCHIGIDGICQEPPYSPTNCAYFNTGSVPTDKGYAAVGQLTMGTGHAGMQLAHRPAVAHYDNTGFAVADVAMGQDAIGYWFAGRLRPGTTPEQVYALRAAGSVSGDWRDVGGHLELCAALVVNVPGFPIPAASVAASGARPTAMVASGVVAAPKAKTPIGTVDMSELASAVEVVLAARDRTARATQAAARLRAGRAADVRARLELQARAARTARATAAAARLTERK